MYSVHHYPSIQMTTLEQAALPLRSNVPKLLINNSEKSKLMNKVAVISWLELMALSRKHISLLRQED